VVGQTGVRPARLGVPEEHQALDHGVTVTRSESPVNARRVRRCGTESVRPSLEQ
jgi:hypothetical protein